jgi:hypothetical protein
MFWFISSAKYSERQPAFWGARGKQGLSPFERGTDQDLSQSITGIIF